MVLLEFIGNFLANICAGAIGNFVTEPIFRQFSASPPQIETSVDTIEERDLHHEPYVQAFSILSRIVSEILFQREIFGPECFRESHSGALEVTTKKLHGRSVAAEDLLLALDRGVFIAFQQGKLIVMTIDLCVGVDEFRKSMEKFTFKFRYGTTAIGTPDDVISMAQGKDPRSVLNNLNQYLQEHPLKKKAPWKILLELSISEMESIPFFRRRDGEMATFGGEPIGTLEDPEVSFILTVETPALPGKQKCVDNNELSSSSVETRALPGNQKCVDNNQPSTSSAYEIFVAEIDTLEAQI